jgi:hypothetical protein
MEFIEATKGDIETKYRIIKSLSKEEPIIGDIEKVMELETSFENGLEDSGIEAEQPSMSILAKSGDKTILDLVLNVNQSPVSEDPPNSDSEQHENGIEEAVESNGTILMVDAGTGENKHIDPMYGTAAPTISSGDTIQGDTESVTVDFNEEVSKNEDIKEEDEQEDHPAAESDHDDETTPVPSTKSSRPTSSKSYLSVQSGRTSKVSSKVSSRAGSKASSRAASKVTSRQGSAVSTDKGITASQILDYINDGSSPEPSKTPSRRSSRMSSRQSTNDDQASDAGTGQDDNGSQHDSGTGEDKESSVHESSRQSSAKSSRHTAQAEESDMGITLFPDTPAPDEQEQEAASGQEDVDASNNASIMQRLFNSAKPTTADQEATEEEQETSEAEKEASEIAESNNASMMQRMFNSAKPNTPVDDPEEAEDDFKDIEGKTEEEPRESSADLVAGATAAVAGTAAMSALVYKKGFDLFLDSGLCCGL